MKSFYSVLILIVVRGATVAIVTMMITINAGTRARIGGRIGGGSHNLEDIKGGRIASVEMIQLIAETHTDQRFALGA